MAPSDTARLAQWEQQCLQHLGARTVLLGVGNRQKGDDAAGCVVAERLATLGPTAAIDCGAAPENHLGRVAEMRPSDVVVVDAADMGATASTVRLMPADAAPARGASTHACGLAPVARFLQGTCGARCWLLGIQPANTGRRSGLTPAVRRAVEAICRSSIWPELLAAEG